MDRAQAEAVYDSGREACVGFLLELTAGFEARAGRYEADVERLGARIARLEEQARSSSRTSSKPPSQDPPKTRQQRRAEARAKAKELLKGEGKREAGAQRGHPGSGRELLPEDQIDEIVDHYPDACGGCGHGFTGAERSPSRRPGRHQVAELPPIRVVYTEHRTHRLRCPECRRRTTAVLGEELAGSAFGPELQAAVVTMTVRNRVSRRDMSELAGELFGIGMSVGTVDAICQHASVALASPHERLLASVLESGSVNVDETGWFRAGDARTMWTATTPRAAVFRIAKDRHRDRLEELIGKEFAGIVCSDRWWAYDHLDPERRQACWEHLKRDFRRHSEGLAEQKLFGEAGVALTARLFSVWRDFSEHQDRRRLRREIKPIQRELRTLLDRAGRNSKRTRFHRVFANNLLKIWPALWTFATVPGVQPTNNAAERSLRGPVIHRKLSHGSRTQDGEQFIERALSASVTCRLQHRSLFSYLRELLTAHNHGDPLPTLT
jgi:transposase